MREIQTRPARRVPWRVYARVVAAWLGDKRCAPAIPLGYPSSSNSDRPPASRILNSRKVFYNYV